MNDRRTNITGRRSNLCPRRRSHSNRWVMRRKCRSRSVCRTSRLGNDEGLTGRAFEVLRFERDVLVVIDRAVSVSSVRSICDVYGEGTACKQLLLCSMSRKEGNSVKGTDRVTIYIFPALRQHPFHRVYISPLDTLLPTHTPVTREAPNFATAAAKPPISPSPYFAVNRSINQHPIKQALIKLSRPVS